MESFSKHVVSHAPIMYDYTCEGRTPRPNFGLYKPLKKGNFPKTVC